MNQPRFRAALSIALLWAAPASAQLMGARELTTTAVAKGLPGSKPVPDIFYLVGESGAKETYTLTIKGPASLTLFTPDGHELASATGSGKVTLSAVLNFTDVFTLAVSRLAPGQAYALSRRATVPSLAEARLASWVGYTSKLKSGGEYARCWITPGVKLRNTSEHEVLELTLAADRSTVTGVGRRGSNTSSYEVTSSVVGDQLKDSYRWPSGTVKESTSSWPPNWSLIEGREPRFTGYLCRD